MLDKEVAAISIVFLFIMLGLYVFFFQANDSESALMPVECTLYPGQSIIMLPKPAMSSMPLGQAVRERKDPGIFAKESLGLDEISRLLWAGNGITDQAGNIRTAPSASLLYPINIYLVPNNVKGAECGIYRYEPGEHKLVLVKEGKFTAEMEKASFGKKYVNNAAAILIFTAVPSRSSIKYGEQGADRVIDIEAGHISQNMLLEASALGIGATPVWSFSQDFVDMLMGIDGKHEKSVFMSIVGKKEG